MDKTRVVQILEKKLDQMKRKIEKMELVYDQIDVDEEKQAMMKITHDYLVDRLNCEVVAIQRIMDELKYEIASSK